MHLKTYPHTYIHICILSVWMYLYIHTCMHATQYTHVHIHTIVHTYISRHTYPRWVQNVLDVDIQSILNLITVSKFTVQFWFWITASRFDFDLIFGFLLKILFEFHFDYYDDFSENLHLIVIWFWLSPNPFLPTQTYFLHDIYEH